MRSYRVGVCDRDIDYSRSFMEYVNSDTSLGFQIVIFTDIDHILLYLESRTLDLIITDDISKCERKGNELYLTDIRVMEMSDTRIDYQNNGYLLANNYIYRYQMASEICKQIKKNLVPEDVIIRNVSEFICVYSPLGRCGKTRLAKTIAGIDEVRGGLYVGMENYSDNLASLTTNMLYPLKMNRSDLEDEIMRQIYQEKGIYMSYLSGTYIDAFDVGVPEIEKLKSLLLKSGSFTTICFDIGTAVLSDFSILEVFDKIYMPVLRDELSINKLEVFMKLLSDMGFKSVIGKIRKVDVPDCEAFSEEMIRTVWKIKSGDEGG